MNTKLEKLLKKRGIEDVTKLDNDEKINFDHWQRILSEGEISVDKIKVFCQNQISLIERKWHDFDNSAEKNQRLIIAHTIYRALLDAINRPAAEREALEKYLNQIIES